MLLQEEVWTLMQGTDENSSLQLGNCWKGWQPRTVPPLPGARKIALQAKKGICRWITESTADTVIHSVKTLVANLIWAGVWTSNRTKLSRKYSLCLTQWQDCLASLPYFPTYCHPLWEATSPRIYPFECRLSATRCLLPVSHSFFSHIIKALGSDKKWENVTQLQLETKRPRCSGQLSPSSPQLLTPSCLFSKCEREIRKSLLTP